MGPAVLPSLLGTHRGFRLDVCPHLWFSCTGFPLETVPAHSRCGDGHAASQAPVECGHCWHPPRSAPCPSHRAAPLVTTISCTPVAVLSVGRVLTAGGQASGFHHPPPASAGRLRGWWEHIASGAIPYFNAFFFSFYLRVFLIGNEAKTDDER